MIQTTEAWSTLPGAGAKTSLLTQTFNPRVTAHKDSTSILRLIVLLDVSLANSAWRRKSSKISLTAKTDWRLPLSMIRTRTISIRRKCLSYCRRNKLRKTHAWKLWSICSRTKATRRLTLDWWDRLTMRNWWKAQSNNTSWMSSAPRVNLQITAIFSFQSKTTPSLCTKCLAKPLKCGTQSWTMTGQCSRQTSQ